MVRPNNMGAMETIKITLEGFHIPYGSFINSITFNQVVNTK
jgi:hypothetical protein